MTAHAIPGLPTQDAQEQWVLDELMKGKTMPDELAVHLLGARTHARDIIEHASVNFWTDDPIHDDFHIKMIEASFRAMAEVLGYDVTKKQEPDA